VLTLLHLKVAKILISRRQLVAFRKIGAGIQAVAQAWLRATLRLDRHDIGKSGVT
jgi:hypothetical protein